MFPSNPFIGQEHDISGVRYYWDGTVWRVKGHIGPAGSPGQQGIQGIQGLQGSSGSGVGDMLKSENLSGLANYTTARSNLGLGTAATVNTGTSGATIPLLNGTNTWSGTNTFTPGLLNVNAANNTTTSRVSLGQIASIDWSVGLTVTNGHFSIGGLGGSVATAYEIQRNGTAVNTHIWNTTASERMRITSTGEIGIGTSSPSAKVSSVINFGNGTSANFNAIALGTAQGQIAGYSFRSTFVGTGDSGPRRSADIWSGYTANWGSEYLAFGVGIGGQNDVATQTTERMRINGAGLVTIPNILNLSDSITNDRTELRFNGGLSIFNKDNTPIFFGTSNVERMRITSTGDVGIGISPTGKLHIAGPAAGTGITLRVSGDAVLGTNGTLFFDDNYSYAGGNYIRPIAANTQAFYTAGSERMRITSAGVIGIGISAPTSRLHVFEDADVWHARVGGSTGELRFGAQTAVGALIQALTPAGAARNLQLQRDGGAVFIAGASNTVGLLNVQGASLGGTAANVSNLATFFAFTANEDKMVFDAFRHTTGTAWNHASLRIRRKVDVSDHNFLEFAENASHIGWGTSRQLSIYNNGEVWIGDVGPSSVLAVGYRGAPRNRQDSSYTLVLADAGKSIVGYGSTASQTWTIPANGSVGYPIGTTITFVNMRSVSCFIALTTDTLYLAGTGTTGTRTLASYGWATAVKVDTTNWMIGGTGLT